MADDDGLNFDFEEQLDVQPEVPAEKVGFYDMDLSFASPSVNLQSYICS
jgi:hypothetical protein